MDGDQGEKVLLDALDQKVSNQYMALHQVMVLRNLDADVILLGPSGIWLLESKYHSGKVICRNGEWSQEKRYYGKGRIPKKETLPRDPYDAQWLRENDAVAMTIARRLPQEMHWLADEIRGGLVFTHKNVSMDIDASCQAEYGKLPDWVNKIRSSPVEDLSFKYLEPETYKHIASLVNERQVNREQYVNRVAQTLETELEARGITAEVIGRPKHIYSIWRKMKRKGVDFDQIFDVRAVRVLVEDIANCYAALGIVHTLWRPVPGEFDDYIAVPKDNLYQSLHTAVVGPEGKTIEVQIRTFEMHQEAELGVAAHWRYKEGSKSDLNFNRKIAWLRQLMEWKEDVADAKEFVDHVKAGVFQDDGARGDAYNDYMDASFVVNHRDRTIEPMTLNACFEQGPIRPPSEAKSLLIRPTRNCPWNKCAFCHTYRGTRFELRSVEEIKKDVDAVRDLADRIGEISWKLGQGGKVNDPVISYIRK